MHKFKFIPKFNARIIAICGLMVALEIIFERMLAVDTAVTRISFTFAARAVSGTCLGPVYAGIIGIISDILGCLYKGYTINLGITFSSMFKNVCFGLLLYNKQSNLRILIAAILDQFVGSFVITTGALFLFGGVPFSVQSLVTRLAQCVTMFAIEVIFLILTRKKFLVYLKNVVKEISEEK